ncbi:BCCT family transporter [Parvularcula sp. ZS-1/3]|uniref:BCCT family transporter n=1 Tax=Parvularcula mediterranea TaxID=2732508 RepID=A0A7Y3RPZ6_9PROT|nr:BCCT family transporter [Parvularcula mediterranea]NNU17591.1 BCCT family transporter [Parvularcula mediterranea]
MGGAFDFLKKGRVLVLIAALTAVAALLFPGPFTAGAQWAARVFLETLDGWTLFLASFCLVVCIILTVHPKGRVKIGGEEAEPEFRAITWVAMMFAAGMGAGLVFWGAAEPLIIFLDPPPGDGVLPGTEEARGRALALTQFHWSLHAWAIYAVAAVAIGLSQDVTKSILPSRPFKFLPRPARRAIDIVALVALLFGLVASLGQGVFQINAGLALLTGGAIPEGASAQAIFLFMLTVAYLGSAWLGLREGIAVLSNINMMLAGLLLVFIFVAGPTGEIFATSLETAGAYLSQFVELSTTLRDDGPGREWTRAWSLVYFLWWVAWTPFVGVFLARISRGRTVRSFVFAAVIVPSLMTLVWFSVVGGTALSLQAGGVDLGVTDFGTAPQAAYVLLENLPLTALMQLVTIILVVIFLITSADSGAYVMAMFSEEEPDPSRGGRMFWGLMLAVLTGAAVLSDKGQDATRALAVAGAVPLTFLLAAQGVAALLTLRKKGSGR